MKRKISLIVFTGLKLLAAFSQAAPRAASSLDVLVVSLYPDDYVPPFCLKKPWLPQCQ